MFKKETQRINVVCAAYPCHKDLEDCTYCWCPFYPCENEENGGIFLTVYHGTVKERIWDCSGCNLVHKTNFVDETYTILKERINLKKI